MKKLQLLGLVFAGLLMCSTATSADYTASELLKHCKGAIRALEGSEKDETDFMSAGLCLGYINGILAGYMGAIDDANIVYQMKHSSEKSIVFVPWSIPAGVSNDMIARVIITHLENNPKEQHNLAATPVLRAIADAYPRRGETP